MLLIYCPYCRMDRPELEFRYGGEAHISRWHDPDEVDDESLAQFLYYRSNKKGISAERWRHTYGCARFFNCVRDTLSDRILATYCINDPQPEILGRPEILDGEARG